MPGESEKGEVLAACEQKVWESETAIRRMHVANDAHVCARMRAAKRSACGLPTPSALTTRCSRARAGGGKDAAEFMRPGTDTLLSRIAAPSCQTRVASRANRPQRCTHRASTCGRPFQDSRLSP
eukprot:353747-Chlamydomonas_euryale.AAC.5